MRKAVCNATPGKVWDDINQTVKVIDKESNINLRKKSSPKTWWDSECDNVIKERKMKLKEFKRTKEIQDYINFKKARAYARKIINGKKKMTLLSSYHGLTYRS